MGNLLLRALLGCFGFAGSRFLGFPSAFAVKIERLPILRVLQAMHCEDDSKDDDSEDHENHQFEIASDQAREKDADGEKPKSQFPASIPPKIRQRHGISRDRISQDLKASHFPLDIQPL
jgi:hypothetical protein